MDPFDIEQLSRELKATHDMELAIISWMLTAGKLTHASYIDTPSSKLKIEVTVTRIS